MEKSILISQTTKTELVEEILQGVKVLICKSEYQLAQTSGWLTSKEVMTMLKISPVTLYNYDKKGLTKPFKIGRSKRYKFTEINEILVLKESQR